LWARKGKPTLEAGGEGNSNGRNGAEIRKVKRPKLSSQKKKR